LHDIEKAQQFGRSAPVNWPACAIAADGSQWALQNQVVGRVEPLEIAMQLVGETDEIVPEHPGLGRLKMGVARHDRVEMMARFLEQGALELDQRLHDCQHAIAFIKSAKRC